MIFFPSFVFWENTVEHVHKDHFWNHQNMVIIDKWSLYRNTVSNDPLIKSSLCMGFLKTSACQVWQENYLRPNQPFTKFVEAVNNLTKLVQIGKHFTKLVKLKNNFTELVEFANNFLKLIEFTNNFTKFVGLAKTFMKFVEAANNFAKFFGFANNFLNVCKNRKIFLKIA